MIPIVFLLHPSFWMYVHDMLAGCYRFFSMPVGSFGANGPLPFPPVPSFPPFPSYPPSQSFPPVPPFASVPFSPACGAFPPVPPFASAPAVQAMSHQPVNPFMGGTCGAPAPVSYDGTQPPTAPQQPGAPIPEPPRMFHPELYVKMEDTSQLNQRNYLIQLSQTLNAQLKQIDRDLAALDKA